MNIAKLFLILFLPLAIISCKKDLPVPQKKEAVLKYTGSYEVDGCGFFLVIDGTEYKPVNENEINNSFKNESETKVVAEYTITAEPVKNVCFAPQQPSYPGVNIISLHKK